MDEIVLVGYFGALLILFVFGLHGFVMLFYHRKYKEVKHEPNPDFECNASVTIQLPLYNELYVVERLIDTICKIDYPRDKFEIQVLDDSTDETVSIAARVVKRNAKKVLI